MSRGCERVRIHPARDWNWVWQGLALPHLPERPFWAPPSGSLPEFPRPRSFRPRCLGQFRLSLSTESQWAPRSFGEVRAKPCHTLRRIGEWNVRLITMIRSDNGVRSLWRKDNEEGRVARWPPVLAQRAREGRAGYPLLPKVQRVMARAVGGHPATGFVNWRARAGCLGWPSCSRSAHIRLCSLDGRSEGQPSHPRRRRDPKVRRRCSLDARSWR